MGQFGDSYARSTHAVGNARDVQCKCRHAKIGRDPAADERDPTVGV